MTYFVNLGLVGLQIDRLFTLLSALKKETLLACYQVHFTVTGRAAANILFRCSERSHPQMMFHGKRHQPLKQTDNNTSPEGRFPACFSGHQISTSSFFCVVVFLTFIFAPALFSTRLQVNGLTHSHMANTEIQLTVYENSSGCD